MNVTEAEVLLGELATSVNGAHVEVGTQGRPPRSHAYLKLTSVSDPESFAIVSTSGVAWYELEVAGGYCTGITDDLATDEDVREYLEEFLRAATEYLDGRWTAGKSLFLRRPFVKVQTESGVYTLGRGGGTIRRTGG
jgi:hypothetical protein